MAGVRSRRGSPKAGRPTTVSGKVLRIILNNMYKSIKACVMDNGMQSVLFESHVGLRQGENLSPLLFALFLNDMETFFCRAEMEYAEVYR